MDCAHWDVAAVLSASLNVRHFDERPSRGFFLGRATAAVCGFGAGTGAPLAALALAQAPLCFGHAERWHATPQYVATPHGHCVTTIVPPLTIAAAHLLHVFDAASAIAAARRRPACHGSREKVTAFSL